MSATMSQRSRILIATILPQTKHPPHTECGGCFERSRPVPATIKFQVGVRTLARYSTEVKTRETRDIRLPYIVQVAFSERLLDLLYPSPKRATMENDGSQETAHIQGVGKSGFVGVCYIRRRKHLGAHNDVDERASWLLTFIP